MTAAHYNVREPRTSTDGTAITTLDAQNSGAVENYSRAPHYYCDLALQHAPRCRTATA